MSRLRNASGSSSCDVAEVSMKSSFSGIGSVGGPAWGCVGAYSRPGPLSRVRRRGFRKHSLVRGTPKLWCSWCCSARRLVVILSVTGSTLLDGGHISRRPAEPVFGVAEDLSGLEKPRRNLCRGALLLSLWLRGCQYSHGRSLSRHHQHGVGATPSQLFRILAQGTLRAGSSGRHRICCSPHSG
jgi:hypothetical protein